MKLFFVTFVFICSFGSFAQRFLTDDYLTLDSTIGGIYGTAIDYQFNNQNLLFDFYAPANDVLSKRPLLIYVHGGGFTSGSRTYPSVQMLCRRMANKGYAVANIDYRLDPGFDIYNSSTNRRAMTDAMHDAKQAIRYFKANAATYGIDTSLIFIGGESAGAATSMMASFVDKQSEMGSYPMANPNDPIGSSANLNMGNGVKGTLCLCGLLLDTLAIESPSDPPVLWTHSTLDSFVPLSLAFNIVLRALNIGLSIETKVYEGVDHCPWYFGSPNWETYLDSTINDITNFLYPRISTLGLNQEKIKPEISIYPNPFKNIISINIHSEIQINEIQIFNLTGQKIETFASTEIINNQINLANLSSGVYFVNVCLETEESIVRKIVK